METIYSSSALFHSTTSLLPIQHDLNEMIKSLPLASFWKLPSEMQTVFLCVDDVFQSENTAIQNICQQCCNLVASHENCDVNELLSEDENIEVGGLNALLIRIHQLPEEVEVEQENVTYTEERNQLAFFMQLYGSLISNLPDVTYNDFVRMDSFYEHIINHPVL